MEAQHEQEPEPESETPDGGGGGGGGNDAEDLPSDFFDEFNKEEFIEGLSIIDSWDCTPVQKSERTQKSEVLDNDNIGSRLSNNDHRKELSQSPSSSRIDEFIKPGSRRDPTKTNQAIKKDKEEKVKEYLAKSLVSSDDLRPPGTELDGYFDEKKEVKRGQTPVKEHFASDLLPRSRSRERHHRDELVKKPSHRSRESPNKFSYRPRWSPRRSPKRSPRRTSPYRSNNLSRNQWRSRYSPQKFFRGSSRWISPHHRSPRRFSPRRSPHRSPRRSPRRSRRSRSRSPYKRSYESQHSRSPTYNRHTDRFLYPADSDLPPNYGTGPPMSVPYEMGSGQYHSSVPSEFPSGPSYSYAPSYTAGYSNNSPYDYGSQSLAPSGIPPPTVPGSSVPALLPNQISTPISAATIPLPSNPGPAPLMVPAPNLASLNMPTATSAVHSDAKNPYDALAKLVAEGKISKEDYLKLAPNKGTSRSLENNRRVMVLNRCNQALSRLAKLHLPHNLLMNNCILDLRSESKYIAPKFCSPLKRQAPIEFLFTKANVAATAQQNKHLVDSIIACLPGVEKVITRSKKKAPKNMKDAAVQTSKPYCDICEIRENTQFNSASTSIDPEHFCSTVHTQVVDQDLISSKTVFNPSGSVGDGAPMSIAHLTPAQLVSQLAARAKTLKQSDAAPSNQYQRHPSNNYDYEYDGRGGQHYQNYNNNYRY